jgi:hypothetical protein
MEFWPEMNKVRVKFIMITDNSIVGPSLTLGCNGGFQWIGAPSNIASTLHQIFTHMSYKMATDLFFTAIHESNVGANNVSPSSVVLLKVGETVVFNEMLEYGGTRVFHVVFGTRRPQYSDVQNPVYGTLPK